jgi:uroporphyrinogen-III synthase
MQETLGIQCVELPLIEHRTGPDLPKLVHILREVEFGWIVVTSPEAAAVFLDAWKDAGFPKARIAVVGTGTGQVFDNVQEGRDQLQVAFTPSKANAKVLAAELPKHNERDSQVLYPASLKASNDLGMKVMMFTICRCFLRKQGYEGSFLTQASKQIVGQMQAPWYFFLKLI